MELLKVENISKSYASHQALDDVSLVVPKQSIYGLLGPNGAGKTTLIRIITQIVNADKGNVYLHGNPITPEDIRKIGYLPEERGLYKKMKVGEQLIYLSRLKGLSKAESVKRIKVWLEKLGIGEWWNKNIEDLSKGMAQKVQFIATVLHEPDLLILDEPFSGFDPVNANLIKDEILELRNKGATIIFSTHRMESVEELCDHIALINKSKKILEGEKKEIKNSFKANTYRVEHVGQLNGLPEAFKIINSEQIEANMIASEVVLQNGHSSNDLIKALIEQVEVHSFIEKVPSINDIFISKVEGGNHE